MKKTLSILACSMVCSLASSAANAPKTTAAVKHEGIVTGWADAQQLNMTQAAQSKLVELQIINDQATAEVKRKQEELATAESSYNAKKNALSKAAREAEESKIVALKTELSSLIENSKLKVTRAVQEKTEEMVAAVEQAAAQVAQAKGLDAIIDTASGRALYVSEKAMVTEDLAKEMNKQFELKVAQGKETKDTKASTPATATKKPQVKA